jgi:hypothetical protein
MRLRTIGFIANLAFGLLAAPLPAAAQPPGKVHRIGLLLSASTRLTKPYMNASRQGMRELGYVEGKMTGFLITRLMPAELVNFLPCLSYTAGLPLVQTSVRSDGRE